MLFLPNAPYVVTDLVHLRGDVVAARGAVVLGRVARLNSWEPVTEPHGTVEQVVSTLTWGAAPVAVAAVFVVIWVGHALVRGTGRAVEARLVATPGTWLRAGAV